MPAVLMAVGEVTGISIDYGAGNYSLSLAFSATDGTDSESGGFAVQVPRSEVLFLGALNAALMNAKIQAAMKAKVESYHGWSLGVNQMLILGLFETV